MSSASSAGPPRKKTKYISIIEECLKDVEIAVRMRTHTPFISQKIWNIKTHFVLKIVHAAFIVHWGGEAI